jgi:SPP1 family predicted phage head-tail adaptor
MIKSKKDKMKDVQVKRKHRLMIQEKTITKDEYLNEVEEWVDWWSAKAERLELFGSDYYAAKQFGEEKTIKWKLKYVASRAEEINTNKFRVINIRTNEVFDIKDTDYLNDDGQFFILKCEKSGDLNV